MKLICVFLMLFSVPCFAETIDVTNELRSIQCANNEWGATFDIRRLPGNLQEIIAYVPFGNFDDVFDMVVVQVTKVTFDTEKREFLLYLSPFSNHGRTVTVREETTVTINRNEQLIGDLIRTSSGTLGRFYGQDCRASGVW